MFSKSQLTLVALSLLSLSDISYGRMQWLERDGRALELYPRRYGQAHPTVLDQLASACSGQVCSTLAAQAVTPLLASQPECSQQDMADAIIDAAQQFDANTKANMIALAQQYRQVEKNTPPDLSTNPPTNQNSVFCQTAPKNAELNGLVQAQDPANSPNVFFDPGLNQSVAKGSQPNTFPFGTAGSSNSTSVSSSTVASAASSSAGNLVVQVARSISADPCAVTVTVTADGSASAAATDAASATLSSSAAAATSTASAASIGNFGSCTIPEITFGVGFDNRKETSFEPTNQADYNHGSADNIDIITQFMCDNLVNTCGADATAQATCATAKAAADTEPAPTGAQADAFNAVFGITTNFAAITALNDQGQPIAGTGSAAASSAPAAASASAAASAATTSVAAAATASAAPASASSASATSSGQNLQTFTGALGGVSAPAVTAAGSQFQVEGNSLFNDLPSALDRSCSVQNNLCADAANASANQNGLTVGACSTQLTACNAA
ncbi:uncharacterized protein PHACADRAFT_252512 [Phanerochaete carnosa HHB-10118-sp]|uniref:Uncharacterized protein n=1 Tax=Phanerochaete carnosa (strain HHB-10118-sp) TaxID=650164 RepID=K5V6J1_PHACS|nr:uncharacterized protein PHACADRAFT_252512 [Phanerochaete carnosa HHB-10118-sp]EKM58301.1 hypothetical protein PHACADRAFT_252512 [Phanerochaete carnosa HHB-10118-sp]